MPEELWTEVCNIVQEVVIKTFPPKKKCKKAKWLSEEALQIAEKRRVVKGKGEKENTHLNAEFQRIARRDKKAFLHEECGRPHNQGSIPWLGRSPGEGNGHPFQYSCLENSMDRGPWEVTVHGVVKSQTQLSN